MAHTPLPPITPPTGLWGLGFRFEVIAVRFESMYRDTKDVWLIGKWLAWPFWFLALYFNIARDKTWEAEQELVKVITWVKGMIEGSTVIDILEALWFEFRFLRANPVGWVKAKIDQVSGELRFLRLDPVGWVQSRLYFAFPVFYSLLGNSGWWIYSKLNERYPQIGAFIRDPWSFIREKVLGLFWWFRDIDRSPSWGIANLLDLGTGWFWQFIINPAGFIFGKLIAYNWNLNLLLTDPVRWVKEKLASVLGMSPYELDTFIPSLIKRAFTAVLTNQAGLLDYVEHSLVELILRFI